MNTMNTRPFREGRNAVGNFGVGMVRGVLWWLLVIFFGVLSTPKDWRLLTLPGKGGFG